MFNMFKQYYIHSNTHNIVIGREECNTNLQNITDVNLFNIKKYVFKAGFTFVEGWGDSKAKGTTDLTLWRRVSWR